MKTSQDPRHQARRIALSVIYSVENTKEFEYSKVNADLIDTVLSNLEIVNYDTDLYKNILKDVSKKNLQYKEVISKNSIDWEVEKIYKTDLSILLMATAELYQGHAPVKVIVDEAVELAKEFGEAESSKFVNGILAGIIKFLEKNE